MSRNRPSSGFSLIELLVVIAIIGVIAGVVVASFSGGIKVWESARLLTSVEQEAYFSAENIRRDLSSTFTFHGIEFSGGERDLSFPGLVPTVDDVGETRSRIGTIKYVYGPAEQALFRLTWPYPESEENADSEIVAEGIEELSFSYLPAQGGDDDWDDAWRQPTNFPAAVSFEISIANRNQDLIVSREIPLTEGLWREEE